MTGWLEVLLGGGAVVGVKKFFTWDIKSHPPCHLVPMKGGRGWPWSRQVICHTTMDGDITVRLALPDVEIPAPRAITPGEGN